MNTERHPVLVIVTCFIFLLISVSVVIYSKRSLAESAKEELVTSNVSDAPTLGKKNAPFHIIVFEEPKCIECAQFSNAVFPLIKKEFIDTGKASYTLILVSFLKGSMMAAEALFSVYYQDPHHPNAELFFSFLDAIYEHRSDQGFDLENKSLLLELASKTSPDINLKQLENSLEKGVYSDKVMQNTKYGIELMNGYLLTPTVYINGAQIDEPTFERIKEFLHGVEGHD